MRVCAAHAVLVWKNLKSVKIRISIRKVAHRKLWTDLAESWCVGARCARSAHDRDLKAVSCDIIGAGGSNLPGRKGRALIPALPVLSPSGTRSCTDGTTRWMPTSASTALAPQAHRRTSTLRSAGCGEMSSLPWSGNSVLYPVCPVILISDASARRCRTRPGPGRGRTACPVRPTTAYWEDCGDQLHGETKERSSNACSPSFFRWGDPSGAIQNWAGVVPVAVCAGTMMACCFINTWTQQAVWEQAHPALCCLMPGTQLRLPTLPTRE